MSKDVNRFLIVVAFIAVFASVLVITSSEASQPAYPFACSSCSVGRGSDSCPCTATEDINLWGMCQKLKWDALLGYPTLIALAGYSIFASLTSTVRFMVARRESREFESQVTKLLFENGAEEAIALSTQYSNSPVALVVHASLEGNLRKNSAAYGQIIVNDSARQRAIGSKTEQMSRGLWALTAVNWTVPLVGLLLLLTTSIGALAAMKNVEGHGISAISGSLANALWAPVFTIVFAIPAIWWHKYLRSRVDSFALEMDRGATAIIGAVVRQGTSSSHQSVATRNLDCYVTQEIA